jgi:CheY-like chemotaxis protein
MSHELRTPMNAIIGYSEMLMEELQDLGHDELLPDLRKVNAAGKHLLAVINDILDLSKIESGKMELCYEEFPVAPMVEDVCTSIVGLAQRNGNTLKVDCAPDVGTMCADLLKVRQCLMNLLSNASKFTQNGTVAVRVRRDGVEGQETVSFAVQDTGIGMTREQVSRVFDAFTQADGSTTRKYGGTGLGLTITKRYCELMGGDILVESELNYGTTFTIRLPAVGVGPCISREIVEEPEVGWRASGDDPVTVLIVDDDADTREILRHALEREGWRVLEAENGKAGLATIQADPPAIVLLDLTMPVMDGFQLLEAIRADPAHGWLPVVVLTAKALTNEERERLQGQVARLVQKGADDTDGFLQTVRTLLRTSIGAREGALI